MKLLVISSLFASVMAFTSFTEDLTGSWKGTVKIPNREDLELTYQLKCQGDSLTGVLISQYGEVPLIAGKIKDTDFSFKMEVGYHVVEQTGKLYGDSIVVKSNFRGTDLQGTFKRLK
jgi:hypothetical protein